MKAGTRQPARGNSKRKPAEKERFLCAALCAMLFTLCSVAEAQSLKKIPVIGIFLPETAATYASYNEAFVQGLRELGYVLGRNLLLEYRYTEGKRERLPELAAELVRLKVDMRNVGFMARWESLSQQVGVCAVCRDFEKRIPRDCHVAINLFSIGIACSFVSRG